MGKSGKNKKAKQFSLLSFVPRLNNEQWINPDFGTPELQRIEETKRHKEQQVSLAEQELKQVKAEIRTDKLKSAATNVATAITSGVGSLFGSGKLKDLEQANESLRYEISKRDKSIDDLKVQIQQIQEQHGRQIRNLQEIHNQKLEAKDKEISRLNTILEKAFCWFPLLKEMLRMEKLCYVIGFTKGIWLLLFYTKGKQSGAAEKSIPKSIDGDLKQKMPLSKLSKVRLMGTSWY